jgi:hypothetical protein
MALPPPHPTNLGMDHKNRSELSAGEHRDLLPAMAENLAKSLMSIHHAHRMGTTWIPNDIPRHPEHPHFDPKAEGILDPLEYALSQGLEVLLWLHSEHDQWHRDLHLEILRLDNEAFRGWIGRLQLRSAHVDEALRKLSGET